MRPIHLRLISSIVSARTYGFSAVTDDGKHTLGWAYATVNDRTGELVITSDWGNFSHIWSPDPKHLGAADLTEFIGRMSDPHYIVDKLLGKSDGREFSAEKTTERLIEDLKEIRRDHIERWGRKPALDAAGRVQFSYPHRYYLTHERFEELCEELREIEDTGTGEAACAVYLERIPQGVHDFLSDIWERCATEETWTSKHLRSFIVPAVIAACREEMERRFRELGVVAQIVQAALEGARSSAYRRSLPACPCVGVKSNVECEGPSTFSVGMHCRYWGSLCGGDVKDDPYCAKTKTRARAARVADAERLAAAKGATS